MCLAFQKKYFTCFAFVHSLFCFVVFFVRHNMGVGIANGGRFIVGRNPVTQGSASGVIP